MRAGGGRGRRTSEHGIDTANLDNNHSGDTSSHKIHVMKLSAAVSFKPGSSSGTAETTDIVLHSLPGLSKNCYKILCFQLLPPLVVVLALGLYLQKNIFSSVVVFLSSQNVSSLLPFFSPVLSP